MVVDVPEGSKGVYLGGSSGNFSEFGGESELLLNRNTKVEVTKVEGNTIHCKVVKGGFL